MTPDFNTGLGKNSANYAALTPLDYIARAAAVYGNRLAIAHGSVRQTWGATYARTRRLASGLIKLGVGTGDTVAVMLPNTPAMVEASFGVPMAGAVLNALNIRLDLASLTFMLRHGQAKVLLADTEFAELARQMAAQIPGLRVIQVNDVLGPEVEAFSDLDYESLLASGDPEYDWQGPADEWDAIALNYTSGTTGDPKGVVYHHRGAALNALSNILEWDMPKHAVYLWTLPMFHCNGWCFPWTVAAVAGTHVCLRRFDAAEVLGLMREHGVTHFCGAPIIMNALVHAPEDARYGVSGVKCQVAGAAPPAAVIEGMERMGFDVTHVYGLTEVYGPASLCIKHDSWNELPLAERAELNARQGVACLLQEDMVVKNPITMEDVPQDGQTVGEIMFRGNITMKGYLKNPAATDAAFEHGWFHTGDLAVVYPDGYVKIRDRSKDVIISGGENISSLEVEDVLCRHAAVLLAAVVAKPDEKWGETPCAFVELKSGAEATAEDIIGFCREHMARFKVPKHVVFGTLPKTSTGKVQKFVLREHAKAI